MKQGDIWGRRKERGGEGRKKNGGYKWLATNTNVCLL